MDSFYSVLRHQEAFTHLILVHGFDVPLRNNELATQVRSELQAAAEGLGLPLLYVRTNVRELATAVGASWPLHYHGAALGGVAQLLAPHIRRAVIPSSIPLGPWGSHIELDHYWSSSQVAVGHDEDISRGKKVAEIATSSIAMDHLRVCWENRGGAYNCGTCPKCLITRTLLAITAPGQQCTTMPKSITPWEILRIPVDTLARVQLESGLEIASPDAREALVTATRRVIALAPFLGPAHMGKKALARVAKTSLNEVHQIVQKARVN